MTRWTPERILALRRRLGLTQVEFAAAVGVVDGTIISRWENGRSSPDRRSQTALENLATARSGERS